MASKKVKTKKKPATKAKPKTKPKPAPKKSAAKKEKVKVAAKTSPGASLFKFHPLDDRVLVEREEALKKTAGGLFIPDSAADAPNQGVVVSVGPGHVGKKGILRPTDVKPGQKIIFNKYAGNELKLANKDYVILRETDIIGIVEE